ncbi:DUF421 domain-containing protein [Virgibacillus salexigens]|uniref:DUF421 domain-containing protein n=1 Tax=Virgibacillus massiliensis TaxID=1462526 RepID=UPI00136FF5E5|nr:YetF domain-containing protein [Virgibacillus massiliensis]MYL42102.1 DUF421 domain-containing protein [Virgibacillus massiliensis]
MEEIIATLFRTPLMFLIILLFFRLTGKKDVGEVSVLEIAITLMVTDLAVIIIEDTELSILNGLVPIVILIIIQYILSYVTLKNQKTRDIMDGRPSLIIENGRCNQVEMKKIGYTLDDLYTELRNNNIADISKVQFAVLESSGDLNVFDDQTKFSLPLILDGVIQTEQVKIMGVNEMWLIQQLEQKGYTDLSSIFICSYTGGNLYIEEKQK